MKLFRHREGSKYDSDRLRPAVRCSICTGERVAGFKDVQSGHFSEIMLICSEKDMERFRSQYGVTGEIEEFY